MKIERNEQIGIKNIHFMGAISLNSFRFLSYGLIDGEKKNKNISSNWQALDFQRHFTPKVTKKSNIKAYQNLGPDARIQNTV